MLKARPKIAVLISGRGSNLQAIIDAVQNKQIPADISLVLSNNPTAYGLERAKLANIPTEVLVKDKATTREHYSQALQEILSRYEPDLVVLAGFMQVLSQQFVHAFQGKLINIHPSLLPAYKGLNTHERVIAAKERFSGVTVHYVTSEVDEGPIIAQSQLEVLPEDTPETLEARIHALEHTLYPEVIAKLVMNNPRLLSKE